MSVRSGWWIGTLMIAIAMATETAGAQRDGGWVGRDVVASARPFVLIDGPREIRVREFAEYRVLRAVGVQLLLGGDGGRAIGWTTPDQVVPVERMREVFTQRIQADPGDVFAYCMRAKSLMYANQANAALVDLARAGRLDPEEPMVLVFRGEAFLIQLKLDAAIVECNRALRLDPDLPEAHELRGVVRLHKRDTDGALDDISRAILLTPEVGRLYLNRGEAWLHKENDAHAILDFTEAIRLHPTPRAHTDRALGWYRRGKLDLALDDCARALRLDPACAEAYRLRASIEWERGRVAAAMIDLSESIRIDPTQAEARESRGRILLDLGRYEEAMVEFEAALRGDPGRPMSHLGRGTVLESRRDYAGALDEYAEAARLAPGEAIAHNSLAWIRATCPEARFRDGALAVAEATRACELSRWKGAEFLDTLAASCAEAGGFEAAAKWISDAIAISTDSTAKARYQAHQKLFRSGAAYRDTVPEFESP